METYTGIAEAKTKCVSLSQLRSLLPKDQISLIVLRACERLELVMNNRKATYCVKVEILMSVVESLLVDCLIRVSPETTSLVISFLLKQALLLVFHGEWGENKMIVKHMRSLFNRLKMRAEKKKLVLVTGKINYLLHLMEKDPWGDAVPIQLFGGETESNNELLEFIKNELGVFLNVRLELMICIQCEMYAMMLIEKCLRCASAPGNRVYFECFQEEINFLKDIYLLLLVKANTNDNILKEISNRVDVMGARECLQCVNRLQNGELPFQILSTRTADVLVSTALASAVAKRDTEQITLEELLQLWFSSISDNEILFRLSRHIVRRAVCSHYIYSFGKKLIEIVKPSEKQVCVEVFVRGLTLNVNEIEKCKTNGEGEKVKQLKSQLADAFIELGEYLRDFSLYRECLLTAFSVDASQGRLEEIKALTTSCNTVFDGKQTMEGIEKENSSLNANLIEKELLQSISEKRITCSDESLVDDITSFSAYKSENHSEDPKEPRCSQSLRAYDADHLGISQGLCDDLSTLMYSNRSPSLSWDIECPELVRRCEKHVSQGVLDKNVTNVENDLCNWRRENGSGTTGNTCNRLYFGTLLPKKLSKRKRKRV